MSTINGTVFPNTTFPDATQTLKTFADLDSTDAINYTNYINAVNDGDWALAQSILLNFPSNRLMSAIDLNQMTDTIMAVEALYEQSGGTFQTYVTQKQAEWQKILDRFGYVGAWNSAIATYSTNSSYSVDNIVVYNSKIWQCIQANDYDSPQIPQADSDYWEQYYRKNTIVSYANTSASDARTLLYVANVDITNTTNPYDSSEWIQFTLKGIQGTSGAGLTFRYAWSASTTYSVDDLVVDDNNVWYSCIEANTGYKPSENPTKWQEEFSANVVQIPIQSSQPDSSAQAVNDIWFETITLS